MSRAAGGASPYRPTALLFDDVTRRGSGGRRRSADAELWRPCESAVATGDRGGVGSLALPRLPRRLLMTSRAAARAEPRPTRSHALPRATP